MKGKLFNRCFLLLLFLLTWFDLSKFQTVPVGKISEPVPIFPQIQINLLKSKNPLFVNDAIMETAAMLITYFVPHLSKESWEIQHLFLDLIPDNEPEVILSLSLPPDRGILILLQKKDNHYFIAFYQDNLSPIAKLESLPLKNDEVLLVTREEQQKQLGALNQATLVKLWKWHENRLQIAFSENTHWEINWQDTWQEEDPKPEKWFNLTQKLTITYRQEDHQNLLRTKGEQRFLEAPVNNNAFPAPYQFPSPFSLLKIRDVYQEYYWNDHWQKFILKTGFYLPPGQNTPEEIAVLKDLAKNLESLAFEKQQQYQVINQKGDLFPLDKNSFLTTIPPFKEP